MELAVHAIAYLVSAIVLFAQYPATTLVALKLEGINGVTGAFSNSTSVTLSLLYCLAAVNIVIFGLLTSYGIFVRTRSKDDERLNFPLALARAAAYVALPSLLGHVTGQSSLWAFVFTSCTMFFVATSAFFLRFGAVGTMSVSGRAALGREVRRAMDGKSASTPVAGAVAMAVTVLVAVIAFFAVNVGISLAASSTVPSAVVAALALFGIDASWVALGAMLDTITLTRGLVGATSDGSEIMHRQTWLPHVELVWFYVMTTTVSFVLAQTYYAATGTI